MGDPRDEARLGRREESDEVSDVCWLTESSHGGSNPRAFPHRLGHGSDQGRRDQARENSVGRDAAGSEFLGDGASERDHAGLARGVGGLTQAWLERGNGGDVDHATPAPLGHGRDGRTDTVERSVQVDLDLVATSSSGPDQRSRSR